MRLLLATLILSELLSLPTQPFSEPLLLLIRVLQLLSSLSLPQLPRPEPLLLLLQLLETLLLSSMLLISAIPLSLELLLPVSFKYCFPMLRLNSVYY